MSLSYLGNKTWNEITREERVFCAELYFQIRNNIVPFLKLINIDETIAFDVGYEVCFYRDVLKEYSKSIRKEQLPQKRTFDLVLMSEKQILLIETKANQGFDNEQLQFFKNDKENICKLFSVINENPPNVAIIAIHSNKYTPSEETKSYFSRLITWTDIAGIYKSAETLFKRANDIYE